MIFIEVWKYELNDFKWVKYRLLLNWYLDKYLNNFFVIEVIQFIFEIICWLKRGEFDEYI